MKRGITAAVLALAFTLSACTPSPTDGYVWAKRHTPMWTQMIPVSNGNGGTTMITIVHPPTWSLRLCAEPEPTIVNTSAQDIDCGWRTVDEHEHDNATIGAHYTAEEPS